MKLFIPLKYGDEKTMPIKESFSLSHTHAHTHTHVHRHRSTLVSIRNNDTET